MAPGLHLNSTSSQPASSPQELLKVPSRTISVLSLVILSVQGDLPYLVETKVYTCTPSFRSHLNIFIVLKQ